MGQGRGTLAHPSPPGPDPGPCKIRSLQFGSVSYFDSCVPWVASYPWFLLCEFSWGRQRSDSLFLQGLVVLPLIPAG